MEIKHTQRGFGYVEFSDHNGEKCTLQMSSAMVEGGAIWLGASELVVQHFVPYQGWDKLDFTAKAEGESYVGNQRMHLTRDQVAALIPVLQHFVDHGELSVAE